MAQSSNRQEAQWTVEAWTDRNGRSPFARWLGALDRTDQVLVDAAVTEILAPLGIDICKTEWGKALGQGLYEFRIRRNLNEIINWGRPPDEHRFIDGGDGPRLLRIFCTFHGNRIVLLFQGYDKQRDPSSLRQRREISIARKHLGEWKRHG